MSSIKAKYTRHSPELKVLKDIQRIFYETTGMIISYSDLKKESEFYFFPSEERALFCKIIQSAPGGRGRCEASDAKGARKAREKGRPYIYRCHAGLIDIAVPLLIKGNFVGAILTGQTLTEPPSEYGFEQVKQRVKGLKLDLAELKKAYYQIKVFPKRALKTTTDFLFFISNYIIEKENVLFLQRKVIEQQKRLIQEKEREERLRRKLQRAMPFLNIKKNLEGGLDRNQRIVRKAKKFIEENFQHPLHLADIAEAVFLSPNHFCTIFKNQVGCSFHQYLIKVRMEKAKDLLENSDLTIKQISYQVGYKDPNYFSRAFRKNIGFSPTYYRERYIV